MKKEKRLRNSVIKIDERLRLDIAMESTTISDWQNIFLDECFNIGLANIAATSEKVSANTDSHGKIGLIAMFCWFLFYNDTHDNQLAKIVHDKSREYFLKYIF